MTTYKGFLSFTMKGELWNRKNRNEEWEREWGSDKRPSDRAQAHLLRRGFFTLGEEGP